ncbi:MAG: F420-dependent glucose-6-phosphate dehydrogenase [Alphaproteobacteria bacterium MarineAlpha10_Bin3]|jgi:alkanesulfonate monooxygenase SsuD/methylene tetrahydromethanopterin reductase-like flavin-dependent oxidoreductase (luciferase family)|nr:MAG: F420-dependent glucose-6-phosphate dehydrogenase [Alphaproteobacteria bacterium MarineAlpha10_Bin3]PPR70523.1 MAG: F420-dependent glucose-6-phosphate dehydrogenase [Alphaproteobacteria bacterium MarineAlpha4_Bin1]
MTVRIGYLLPTRERVMGGQPETAALLALADRAEGLGLDSLWVGDSLLAKPRHEPLALLAAIAGRTRRITLGTAVLLPILRNPVLLAHQVATLDQLCEGRLILGIGSGNDQPAVRAEFDAAGVAFEKRVGRMMEGMRLCQALWSGKPVDWDGRWTVRGGVLGPTPHTPGGPPIWGGGGAPGTLRRTGRTFDGWFPSGPNEASVWRDNWATLRGHASAAGRDPDELTGAVYLTLCIDEDVALASRWLNAYLEQYYGQPAEILRRRQGCYAGSWAGAVAWLQGFVDAGATHLALRFPGEHERNMAAAAQMKAELVGKI